MKEYKDGKKVYRCDKCKSEVWWLYVIWDANGQAEELCRACFFGEEVKEHVRIRNISPKSNKWQTD